jgi:hypothetical protein
VAVHHQIGKEDKLFSPLALANRWVGFTLNGYGKEKSG